MTPDTATLMAHYNHQMNIRLYQAAGRLPTLELHRNRGAFFGSLFSTLNHIAVGDSVWLHRFAAQPQAGVLRAALAEVPHPTSLRQPLADSLPALHGYRERLDRLILVWADTLTEAQLTAPLSYRNMAGQPQRKRFAHLVQHFFNHQTHHRGQASTLLYQAGEDVGVTDLVAAVPDLLPS